MSSVVKALNNPKLTLSGWRVSILVEIEKDMPLKVTNTNTFVGASMAR
jgi:hypothetical protein